MVWDGGKSSGENGGTIPGFIRNVTTSLPPTLDVLSDIVGEDLPPVLGDKTKNVDRLPVLGDKIEDDIDMYRPPILEDKNKDGTEKDHRE